MTKPKPFTPRSLQPLREFECQIWGYSPSLSRLLLRLLKGHIIGGETHFVLFTAVEFFAGPMAWKANELRIGSTEEALIIGERIHGPDYRMRFAGPHEASSPTLYLFDDKTKILSHSALLYDDLPLL